MKTEDESSGTWTSHSHLSLHTSCSRHPVLTLNRAIRVRRQLVTGGLGTDPGKDRLLATRRDVVRGWNEVADDLVLQNQVELAQAVRRFEKELPPARTEAEWIRHRLLEQSRVRHREERTR